VVDRDVLRQPAGSKVHVEQHADGVAIRVPPAGLWRGSQGAFVFALLWCALCAAVTVSLVSGLLQGGEDIWIGLLFLGAVFWPAGVGMLLLGINMGRRRAVLAVAGDQLVVERTGLFGTKHHAWQREEISDVRAGPSGMTVNDEPVLELQIHPRQGKKVGLLAGRDAEELRWLATTLRRALGLAARPEGETGGGVAK
jgi:hypothetical protein